MTLAYGSSFGELIYSSFNATVPPAASYTLYYLKEDINNELETLITKHSNVYYEYEISDDFKQLDIYLISGDSVTYPKWEAGGHIGTLIELYHKVKEGRGD